MRTRLAAVSALVLCAAGLSAGEGATQRRDLQVLPGIAGGDVMSRLGLAHKYRPYAADAHTALLLHFDGDARDASARACPCRARGVDWREDGIFGQAARLDGNQDITVEGIPGGALAEGFTVEAWVLIDRPAAQQEYRLLERRNSFDWRIRTYPGGYAKLLLTVWTDRGAFKAKSKECLPYGVWLHVSGLYNPRGDPRGKARPLALYVHGSSIQKLGGYERQEKPAGRLSAGTGSVRIAAGFAGAIDELRLSSTPRSQALLVAPWLSGRWGDFTFTPPDVTVPRPRDWEDRWLWLSRAQGVATFEALGLYVAYEGDVNANGTCRVRVRARGDRVWRPGMDLVRDPEIHEFRGSLLMLQPGTTYEIELRAEDPDADPDTTARQPQRSQRTQRGHERQRTKPSETSVSSVADVGGSPAPLRFTKRTWDEEVPVGEVRRLPAGVSTEPIAIDAQGRADAWIMYTSAENASSTVDAGTRARDAIHIERAAYVILEGITIRGGTEQAVRVVDSHHIRIRRCEMTGWGTPGRRGPDGRFVDERGRLINYHTGVYVGAQCRQVVVEHNFIHTPRGTANSWLLGHPVGPQGIVLAHTGGNNVIRYNDIIGSETHWWNDAIESIPNSAVSGGPYRDTDIYGNMLLFSNDDGTELDGGQINVRYWGNRIEKALCGISCAPCRKGPCYVFRNLIVRLGEERNKVGSAFKMGGGKRWSTGLDLILHNSIIGRGRGLASVGYGHDDDRGGYHAFARNNLFSGPSAYIDVYDSMKDPLNSFDYDLMGRQGANVARGNEEHGISARPVFMDPERGDYRLSPDSPGRDAGVVLPGLNDDFAGGGPDMGALESDDPAAFPYRPTGMRVRPQHAVMRAEMGGGASTFGVELTAPRSAGETWVARPNVAWLRCVPGSGTTQDRPQRLVLQCDARQAEVRQHRSAVTFRTDRGFNRTLTVDVKVYRRKFTRRMEAESADVAGGMVIGEDPAASGGRFVHTPVPPRGGDNVVDPTAPVGPDGKEGRAEPGTMTFVFAVPEDGPYFVIAGCMVPAPTGIHDSFFFSMDGQERAIWDVHAGPQEWVLDVLNRRDGRDPHTFNLSRGTHTLVLGTREQGARLDYIIISSNPYAEADDR